MGTIIALASGSGKSGVAIIRVSGPNSLDLAEFLTKRREFAPRYAHLCQFFDSRNEIIDSGLCLYFPAPNSFTGEDVIEFHLHGSRAIVKKFLEVAIGTDLVRLAKPGEFSRRAFLNDKMDLAQAEGLLDLIDSETEAQRQLSLRIMKGELGDATRHWREKILKILAEAEAYIDFPDEDLPEGLSETNRIDIAALIDELRRAADHFKNFQRIRDGFNIVIIGPPNAGKSSLLNALCGKDAAIVSSIAGTTRDIIEVSLSLGGYLVHFNDTAGLRESADTIEQEGIKRALERCEHADLIIGLVENFDHLKQMQPHLEADSFVVWSKSDLAEEERFYNKIPNLQFEISVNQEDSLRKLEAAIIERIAESSQISEFAPITRMRHLIAINETIAALERSLTSSKIAIEIGCEDLRVATSCLGEIVGHIGIEDLLDRIFSSFCIGK